MNNKINYYSITFKGKKIVNFNNNNLHILNYSTAVRKKLKNQILYLLYENKIKK